MKVLHSMGRLVNAWFDYSAKIRTINELSQLTDHQLEDIGLSRHQLNLNIAEMWTDNNDTVMPDTVSETAAQVESVEKQKSESGFGMQLVSLYSAWNRTDYIV